jgi:hypothetical protein
MEGMGGQQQHRLGGGGEGENATLKEREKARRRERVDGRREFNFGFLCSYCRFGSCRALSLPSCRFEFSKSWREAKRDIILKECLDIIGENNLSTL